MCAVDIFLSAGASEALMALKVDTSCPARVQLFRLQCHNHTLSHKGRESLYVRIPLRSYLSYLFTFPIHLTNVW